MNALLTVLVAAWGLLAGGQAWAQAPERPVAAVAPTVNGVQVLQVEGGSYFFRPDHIVVRVNVPVELTVRIEAGLSPHNWVIHAPEAGMDVEENLSSQPKTIRFTPTAVGQYPFYCSKKAPLSKSHRERGMEGVIEVVP